MPKRDSYPDKKNPLRATRGGSIIPGGKHGYMAEERKLVADSNRVSRAARSDQEQLAELDARLGAGVGAKRERARLKGNS